MVYVNTGRGTFRADALIELLFKKTHIKAKLRDDDTMDVNRNFSELWEVSKNSETPHEISPDRHLSLKPKVQTKSALENDGKLPTASTRAELHVEDDYDHEDH